MLKLHVVKGMMQDLGGNHWKGSVTKVCVKTYTIPVK